MRVIDVQQGTDEWKAMRSGKVTASRISDVLATVKSGEAATRRNYKAQIVAEILTGAPMESGYTNAAMQWGNDQELFARAAYELKNDVMVDQVGFVLHSIIEGAGCSPDGLVGKNGLVEIKCPNTATHLEYILGGKVPSEYIPQIQWQLACTGREWCDFVSYDPRLLEHLQLFVKMEHRNDSYIANLEAAVLTFLEEVDGILARLPQQEVVSA